MTVKELLTHENQIVPFPWTIAKIKKAGHNPKDFLIRFGQELERCNDKDSEESKKIMSLLHELKMFG